MLDNTIKTAICVNLFYNICQATHNIRNKASNYRIYSRTRRVFSLKFGTQICEVILNMRTTWWTALCQTGSLWTRSCKAKPWPASTNHCARSPFFWDTLQCWVVIP